MSHKKYDLNGSLWTLHKSVEKQVRLSLILTAMKMWIKIVEVKASVRWA